MTTSTAILKAFKMGSFLMPLMNVSLMFIFHGGKIKTIDVSFPPYVGHWLSSLHESSQAAHVYRLLCTVVSGTVSVAAPIAEQFEIV